MRFTQRGNTPLRPAPMVLRSTKIETVFRRICPRASEFRRFISGGPAAVQTKISRRRSFARGGKTSPASEEVLQGFFNETSSTLRAHRLRRLAIIFEYARAFNAPPGWGGGCSGGRRRAIHGEQLGHRLQRLGQSGRGSRPRYWAGAGAAAGARWRWRPRAADAAAETGWECAAVRRRRANRDVR